MRRLLRDISSVLILSGLLLLLDGGITLLWQEPVTAAIALLRRQDVNRRYLSYTSAPLTRSQTRTLRTIKVKRVRIAYLAREDLARIHAGDAIGQIDIPRIGNTYNVIQGTDESDLEAGPGHYPTTALPGMGQTVGIAGHRTTYLAPFRFINDLRRGDRIIVTMPYGVFTYVVTRHRIVLPSDVAVVRDVGYDQLVLSACNPLYSAAQRYIVFARLRHVVPRGPALAG
ncbi:MAG TPA: class E sortase [Solirubrobacteraceae bacterium]|nr:class E sortase [Solirubrobacteraceae bacterium]